MPAAGVLTILAVLAIVVALLVYLIPTILALRAITTALDDAIEGVGGLVLKSEPVNAVVTTINGQLDAAVDALEGLLVNKAGLNDAMGLLDGLYPGSAAFGLRNFPQSRTLTPPRIAEVYTKGTLTLARLGREAPIAAASPEGPVLRDVVYASLSARALYPEARQGRPPRMPRSPVIGTDAPTQYEPAETPGERKLTPAAVAVAERPPAAVAPAGAAEPPPERTIQRPPHGGSN